MKHSIDKKIVKLKHQITLLNGYETRMMLGDHYRIAIIPPSINIEDVPLDVEVITDLNIPIKKTIREHIRLEIKWLEEEKIAEEKFYKNEYLKESEINE